MDFLWVISSLKPCIIVKSFLVHYKISAHIDSVAGHHGLPHRCNWMNHCLLWKTLSSDDDEDSYFAYQEFSF